MIERAHLVDINRSWDRISGRCATEHGLHGADPRSPRVGASPAREPGITIRREIRRRSCVA